MRALGRSVEQFAIGDDREGGFSRTELLKPLQDFLRPFLPDVNTDVRIQQVASFHHSPLRFCGRYFSRPRIAKSTGRSAKRSNARSIVPSFSRKTISSPRR